MFSTDSAVRNYLGSLSFVLTFTSVFINCPDPKMPVNKATSKAGASAKRSRAHGSGLSSDEEESRSAQHKKQLASKNKKTLGSTKTNKRQQRSHGPTKSNPQDLFQKLSHDEVFLILSYLEPADFEALRRTSKLWKATSELHCGRTFLLKHFPSTPLPSITLKDGLSKRDADAQYHGACNLLYRRACKSHSSTAAWYLQELGRLALMF